MIFFSIPFCMFIYRVFYQIDFFSHLHSLALFIVLGVGADDVFVLVDAWKDSKREIPYESSFSLNDTSDVEDNIVHQRLKQTYTHTLSTVFNTSFTTAFAFMATGLSPLMTIRLTLSIFAAQAHCFLT